MKDMRVMRSSERVTVHCLIVSRVHLKARDGEKSSEKIEEFQKRIEM